MVDDIVLTPEELFWFVEPARATPPPQNARLNCALRGLAKLATERPDGTVVINWKLQAKDGEVSQLALQYLLDGPMAATPEAQAEQILGLVTWINMGQRDRACRWFDTPIDHLGGKSPRQLVTEGHAEGIRDYILSISSGTVG